MSAPEAPVAKAQKTITGIVTSDKMQKTRAVKIMRLERHAKYGKFIRRHTTYKVHDEKEVSHIGDTVRIAETRPLSKTKRWRLVEIIVKSRYGNVATVDVIGALEAGALKGGAAEGGAGGGGVAS